jgi:peptidoglycan/LPS O-acetylase OafA/YrhL
VNREPGLDAARAFAMLLVVAVHAAIPFMATPIGWAVEDDTYAEAVDLFVWAGHAFLMPVFFWLAGYFGRIVVERDGATRFVRGRLLRVALPLAVAIVPCSLALHAEWDWAQHRHEAVATLRGTGLAIDLGHLWYLYYLLIVSAVALVARRLRVPLAAVIGVPVVVMCAARTLQIDTPLGFAIDPVVLGFHGAFFAWGWMTRDPRAFARLTWPAAIASLGLIAALVPALLASASAGEPSLVASAGAGALAVTGVVAFVGACMRCAERPWIRFAAEASYWSYIVHLPLVVLLQVALAGVALPGPLKLAAILGGALVACFASYALLVRPTLLRRAVG